jgi:NAD(P)-dependent dehydrogenase (short-subunit alcohol dehydrogenase family)
MMQDFAGKTALVTGSNSGTGKVVAQASSRWTFAAAARTRTSPRAISACPIATAVCDHLCGSTPIITAAMTALPLGSSGDPWQACLITDQQGRSR